jgi:2-oxoglutarate ferredoxin oxidoreductase subunit alpha
VPLVIVDVQRLGPSTGGATTVGQGDVQFVRWGTAGGYPIIALSPSSISECYSLTMRAFDLAERFRCPVFLLTDKELNMTMNTVDLDQYEDVPVRERETYRAENGREEVFAPYCYQPLDGVPPMAHYDQDVVVRFTGSTHDERAFITKHPPTVGALNRHLAAKIEEHRDEIELVRTDLEPGAKTLLISYGVTARAMREAVGRAREQGKRVSTLTIHSLWPVPETAIQSALGGIERVVVAELNLGQYRREIQRFVSDRDLLGLNRVDGELISPDQFLEVIR